MSRIQRITKGGLSKFEVETELELYAKLKGRVGGQELAGAKEAAEGKPLTLVAFPGSTAQALINNTSFSFVGASGGINFETISAAITFKGGLTNVKSGFWSEAGGRSEGTLLAQLAFAPITLAAEITSNRKDYGALNAAPTVWWRLKSSKIVAIFGLEAKELTLANRQEGKIYVITNVGANAIDFVGENTECATVTDRLKIRANTGTNNFEGTIAAGSLTEIKEITNFRFLYPGSKVTDTGGVIKAGTTINSTNEAAKTAIMSEAATGEHAKESMTASYANVTTLGVDESLWLGYDAKSERWRVIGGPSG